MLIRLLRAHEMTKHLVRNFAFKFQAVAEKTAKNVRDYFILPHPVDHLADTGIARNNFSIAGCCEFCC